MSITIDEVERAAWHLAAEPIPARMNELLSAILLFAEPEPVKAEAPVSEGPPPTRKLCKKCNTVKNIEAEFNKDSSTKDGFRYACRPCEQQMRRNQARARAARGMKKTDPRGARLTHLDGPG